MPEQLRHHHLSPFADEPQNAGFTLLEVLVALIIIGLSLGALFQAISQSKKISWKSDEKIEAARIANNILSNSSLIYAILEEKEKKGSVQGEEGWRYTLSVRPLELKEKDRESLEEIPYMMELVLCLIHESAQRERPFCLSRWLRVD